MSTEREILNIMSWFRKKQSSEDYWTRPIDHIVVDGLRINGEQFLTGAVHDLDTGTVLLSLTAKDVSVVYKDTLALEEMECVMKTNVNREPQL